VKPDGRYVNEIRGAHESGDRTAGLEWIAVPDDVDVRFIVRSDDVAQFVAESDVAAENVSTRFRTSVTRYGADPRVTTEDGQFTVTNATVHASDNRSLAPGETAAAVPDPVFATFTSTPSQPTPNRTVTFDAGLSFGLNTSIADYEWTFGDGTTATGQQVDHAFDSEGEYTVTLTVTDDDGATATDTVTVQVEQCGIFGWFC
jgi:chitinase